MLNIPLPLAPMGVAHWLQTSPMPLIALVASPDGDESLRVANLLARAIDSLGYPTGILDGECQENDGDAGLIDILEHRMVAQPSARQVDDLSFAGQPLDINRAKPIAHYPAAMGLRALLAQSATTPAVRTRAIQTELAQAFSAFSALVLHADAGTLGRLIDNAQHIPVLTLKPEPDALLAAYDNLKALCNHQAIDRALVITERDPDMPAQVSANIFNSLARCADKYLGCKLHHCHIVRQSDADALASSLRRWMIPLLRQRPTPMSTPQRPVAAARALQTQWSH